MILFRACYMAPCALHSYLNEWTLLLLLEIIIVAIIKANAIDRMGYPGIPLCLARVMVSEAA